MYGGSDNVRTILVIKMNIVEFDDISIQFPGVMALKNISFNIEKGEIMALCGENGAGKSTLAKVLAGIYSHNEYSGEIRYCGKTLKNSIPVDAEERGIFMVHQELTLFREMTVAENIFLSHFPTKHGVVDYKKMEDMTEHYLTELGLHIDPNTKIKDLTVAMQQMVEIAKALSGNTEIIIFDESTSALTNNEIKDLFNIIRELKKKEVTVIFVTHKLDEIFEICDTVTVLKDGTLVEHNIKMSSITKEDVIRMMIGRELKEMFPEKPVPSEEQRKIFEIRNWCLLNPERPDHNIIDHFSFDIKENEIVGMYGLVGAGRTELVNSIFEGVNKHCSGEILLNGEPLTIKSTCDAVKHGISLITEDRKNSGLFLKLSVSDNLSVASLKSIADKKGIINDRTESERNERMIRNMAVKMSSKQQLIESLSGGNQQKVIIGKWLLTSPKVLILDEPTKGIDVGSKSEIYKMLRKLSEEGIAILIVSSELPEIIGLCDRVIVVREGKHAGEFQGCCSEEMLLNTAMGRM
ncbi:MAG TPA: sugar ABC transporter ATP-binding protein [Anaerovoracaceae bacterium]|nr:sugar ABC transporter ATP-binding protein [Anaerovoracaceae bacterium]